MLAALSGLLPRLLLLLIRLLLSTAWLSALTWLLARLLGLLSALFLLVITISNWNANYLAMDNSPLGFFVPSSATYIIRDRLGPTIGNR